MPQTSAAQQIKQTETNVAVLQVQYSNLTDKVESVKESLSEKVDDLKESVEKLDTKMDVHSYTIQALMKGYQTDNTAIYETVNKRLGSLEKWKWTLAGAFALASAVGVPILIKLFLT